MASMKSILNCEFDKRVILQGNIAFALGVLHAGYHAADGYPGTPSTEILDHLRQVPELITAEWSVNEAVAVGVGVGHAIAGHDTVVTMKVPGLFQAGDVVASAAFSDSFSGALVLFVATDHAPSSTQYLVDSRHFLSSLHLPILEPRNHQDLYLSAFLASDLSRRHSTPVVILCSSVLCHSEGIITPLHKRTIDAAPFKQSLSKVLLPKDARSSFVNAVEKKTFSIRSTITNTNLLNTIRGNTNWGIITCGEASIIAQETLCLQKLKPHQLQIGISYPLPITAIKEWAKTVNGPLFLFEDGERFVEMQLRQDGIEIIGKETFETVTHWTPDLVAQLLANHGYTNLSEPPKTFDEQSLARFPAICPGCPYKAISLAIQNLKRRSKIDLVFGDIGCSTLLHFQNALDINLCMGASESMRQGYVRSKPEMANRVISLIGDSSECHSGMDASRNAIFRNTPGVKVILDNSSVAMTGGQASPTRKNSSGEKKFFLDQALEAEGIECVKVNAYNYKQVLHSVEKALEKAATGRFISVLIEGECIESNRGDHKRGSHIVLNTESCTQCGLCSICPAIDYSPQSHPVVNGLCTRCGNGDELCIQRCPVGALSIHKTQYINNELHSNSASQINISHLPESSALKNSLLKQQDLLICNVECNNLRNSKKVGQMRTPETSEMKKPFPDSLRVLICGVGGQGNLFLGKVLTHVMESTHYISTNILKGEVHGMAQKGGCVNSTFACGNVYSPIFASQSVDVMIAMEQNEALRPQYLHQLKHNATIILNPFSITPADVNPEILRSANQIVQQLSDFNVVLCDASRLAPSNANVLMLGLLSTISPFSIIPVEQWISVLASLSKNATLARQNVNAFECGHYQMNTWNIQKTVDIAHSIEFASNGLQVM